MTNDEFRDSLDAALMRVTKAPPADEAAVARVLKRLSPPLPRQKIPLWRLAGVLLDWQLAPAWPRVAALACSAALGFYIGIAGLDRPFDRLDAPFASSGTADIGAFAFEADPPLSGARQ